MTGLAIEGGKRKRSKLHTYIAREYSAVLLHGVR
jgi:hypothetical protein